MARQVKKTGGRCGSRGWTHCPCMCLNVLSALFSPRCDAVPAFEPFELATAGFYCSLRRFQSSHARVDEPLFLIGLKDLWLYPDLVWPVRRNRCPGCGRGRTLATACSHTRQLGARWGPTLENCPKNHTSVHLTRFTTLPDAPTRTHTPARMHARNQAHTNTHTNQCMRMWSTLL